MHVCVCVRERERQREFYDCNRRELKDGGDVDHHKEPPRNQWVAMMVQKVA